MKPTPIREEGPSMKIVDNVHPIATLYDWVDDILWLFSATPLLVAGTSSSPRPTTASARKDFNVEDAEKSTPPSTAAPSPTPTPPPRSGDGNDATTNASNTSDYRNQYHYEQHDFDRATRISSTATTTSEHDHQGPSEAISMMFEGTERSSAASPPMPITIGRSDIDGRSSLDMRISTTAEGVGTPPPSSSSDYHESDNNHQRLHATSTSSANTVATFAFPFFDEHCMEYSHENAFEINRASNGRSVADFRGIGGVGDGSDEAMHMDDVDGDNDDDVGEMKHDDAPQIVVDHDHHHETRAASALRMHSHASSSERIISAAIPTPSMSVLPSPPTAGTEEKEEAVGGGKISIGATVATTTITTNATTKNARFHNHHPRLWSQRYDELVLYKQRHGHCFVDPKTHKALSAWSKRQRHQYVRKQEGRPSTLTEERERKMNDLDFAWDAHEAVWEQRFQELVQFRAQHGHVDVPGKYAANRQLGIWVKCQRKAYAVDQRKAKSSSKEEMPPFSSSSTATTATGGDQEQASSTADDEEGNVARALWSAQDPLPSSLWVLNRNDGDNAEPDVASETTGMTDNMKHRVVRYARLQSIGFKWTVR
mmetsp:Transcript_5662/g.16768  ORF Transcript_5662/g.16768 Transcript_5662/m.16768 type:complete len:597 (-) Transcript_5662:558-2348(-)